MAQKIPQVNPSPGWLDLNALGASVPGQSEDLSQAPVTPGDSTPYGVMGNPVDQILSGIPRDKSDLMWMLGLALAPGLAGMAFTGPKAGKLRELRNLFGGRLDSHRLKLMELFKGLGQGPLSEPLAKTVGEVAEAKPAIPDIPWGTIRDQDELAKAMWGEDMSGKPFETVGKMLQKRLGIGQGGVAKNPEFAPKGITQEDVDALVPGGFAEAIRTFDPTKMSQEAKDPFETHVTNTIVNRLRNLKGIQTTASEAGVGDEGAVVDLAEQALGKQAMQQAATERAMVENPIETLRQSAGVTPEDLSQAISQIPSLSVAQAMKLKAMGLRNDQILSQMPSHGRPANALPGTGFIPRSPLEVRRALEIGQKDLADRLGGSEIPHLDALKAKIDALGPDPTPGGRKAIIPPVGRKALWMLQGQGMSVRKTADKLGVDPTTVSEWLRIARKTWGEK